MTLEKNVLSQAQGQCSVSSSVHPFTSSVGLSLQTAHSDHYNSYIPNSASFIVCTEVPWTVTFAYCSFSCHLTKRSCLDLESALKLGSVSWTKCQAQARFESIQHVNPAPCTQAFLQSHSPSTVNSQPSDNYQIPPSESGSSRAAGRRAPVHCFHHHIYNK